MAAPTAIPANPIWNKDKKMFYSLHTSRINVGSNLENYSHFILNYALNVCHIKWQKLALIPNDFKEVQTKGFKASAQSNQLIL